MTRYSQSYSTAIIELSYPTNIIHLPIRSIGCTIVQNPPGVNTFVPPTLTIQDIECSIQAPPIEVGVALNINFIRAYLVRVPEGVNIEVDWDDQTNKMTGLLIQHPEWIIDQRSLPIYAESSLDTILSSHKDIILNSGDKIRCLIVSHWGRGGVQMDDITHPFSISASLTFKTN